MINKDEQRNIWVRSIEQTYSLNPQTTLAVAKRIADDMVELRLEASTANAMVLAIMREYMQINDGGRFPAEVQEKIDANPRLKNVIAQATILHGGWACSPFSGGFKEFDKRVDDCFKE